MVTPEGGFWQGALTVAENHTALEDAHHVAAWVKYLPLGISVGGIFLAYLFYIAWPCLPSALASRTGPLYRFLLNKWYFDELYDFLFVRGAKALGRIFWKRGDEQVIDRFGPNGFAWGSQRIANRTSKMQTGYIYHYAFAMLLGLLTLMTWLVYKQFGGMPL